MSIICWEDGGKYHFPGLSISQRQFSGEGGSLVAAGGGVQWPGKGDLLRAPTECTTRILPTFLHDIQTYHGMALATWGVQRDEWMEFRRDQSADL